MGQFAEKLVEKLNKHVNQAAEKSLSSELETNICGVCTNLMISPNEPYILFPCGHSFCKQCIYSNPTTHQMNFRECPYCRTRIDSCAINRSLLNLIRKYKEAEEIKEDKQEEEAETIGIRCNILSHE